MTARELCRVLADGEPHTFRPDRRTMRGLLALALKRQAHVVGPVRGGVTAVRAGLGWRWSYAEQRFVRPGGGKGGAP